MTVGALNPYLLLAVPLTPLLGAIISGLFGTKFLGNLVGRKVSHSVTILGEPYFCQHTHINCTYYFSLYNNCCD